MNNETLFTEKQKFTQWWLWVILIGLNGIFIYAIFKQVIGGQPFGDKPSSNESILFLAGLFFLITIFFFSIRLNTIIKKNGIYLRLAPFHRQFKHYTWDSLAKLYVREYAPLREYGGWGIRFGRNGTAYNISGNKGLQLEFKDNKKILIGTNKPEELAEVLSKIGQLKP